MTRLLCVIFILLTGMNSSTDLIICHHNDGEINIVTGDDHRAIHCRDMNHGGNPCKDHEKSDCLSCYDIPLQIRNISLPAPDGFPGRETCRFVSSVICPVSQRPLGDPSPFRGQKGPDLPALNIFRQVVLLI